MMHIPDEMLMAYADGELTAEEARALDQMLRQDAMLRARLEPFVHTRTHLAAVFEPALHDPIPERLIAAVRRGTHVPPVANEPISLASRMRRKFTARPAGATTSQGSWRPMMAASIAALVVASAAGGWIAGRASTSHALIASSGPFLVAQGPLAKVLEDNRSNFASDAGGSSGEVVPVLSFKSKRNMVCREYRVRGTEATRDFAGLACRTQDGTWRVALHVETPKQLIAPPKQPGGTYETATGPSVPAVDALVDSLMNSEAFGKDDERALLKNHWQIPETPPSAQ